MPEVEEYDVQDDVANDGDTHKKPNENYCPFGCLTEDLNDRGYCKHLAGFTNDKKVMEPLVAIMGRDADNKPEETGNYRVMGRKGQTRPIPTGAKLVNPTSRQLANGVWHIANKWVSWRVYLKNPEIKKLG